LLCAPYFSTVALAANALLASGDDQAKKDLLPGIASGETIATVAFTEDSGRWDGEGITATATRSSSGEGWTLDGHKMFVIDGHTANLIIVAARTDAGVSLFAVDGSAAGLTRTALSTMDQTRKQARLELSSTPARLIGSEGQGWAILSKMLDLAAVALAAEQVGGAQKVLDMSVEYAKVRVQFGRPIGSFQAIKHKCADMLLEVESAKSAAYYAGRGVPGQGLLLGRVLPLSRRKHPDSRWDRLHVGASRPPVFQAGQEFRAAVRRSHLSPRTSRPTHRHLAVEGGSPPLA
jgi:alkylation response protein AidB-like acyl-CoA dehydrogenase